MKPSFLLPNKYKKLGWFIFIPAAVAGILFLTTGDKLGTISVPVWSVVNDKSLGELQWFSIIKTNVAPSLIGIAFIAGSALIGFSQEKNEDEYIGSLRLSALLWAVLVNYGLLLFAFTFIYGISFLTVMMYNMFTIPLLFILRFHFLLYRQP